jgi:hypothetical protein
MLPMVSHPGQCLTACHGRENDQGNDDATNVRTDGASDPFNSRCGRFLYSALAETFRTIRGIDFATRLGGLFESLETMINAETLDLPARLTRAAMLLHLTHQRAPRQLLFQLL